MKRQFSYAETARRPGIKRQNSKRDRAPNRTERISGACGQARLQINQPGPYELKHLVPHQLPGSYFWYSGRPPGLPLVGWTWPNAFAVQKLRALGFVIPVGHFLIPLLFKRCPLLLVEGEGLLQPPERAALLLDCLPAARLIGPY